MPRWLLPESISDVLPSEARAIEMLRRRLLDLYRTYGYELVMPPLLEHIESLLTGSGRDLAHRTFQLVDQLSGRTLGVRADMTPQVARIDAHLLNREGVARLCYAGPVLHARPSDLFASREPLQVGAELYGHAGAEADLEVIELMIASLAQTNVRRIRLDLCHMGIVSAILALDPSLDEAEIYTALQRKDAPGLAEYLERSAASGALATDRSQCELAHRGLLALLELYGDADGPDSVLTRARSTLPQLPQVHEALETIERLVSSPLWQRYPQVEISIDLADLRGYRYHTGISFAAYVDDIPNAVARGGRYDDIGRDFGRARPATGFSLELRELASLAPAEVRSAAVRAPWSDDPVLAERIAELRSGGEIVLQTLPGHEHEQLEFCCDRELAFQGGHWVIRTLG